MVLGNEINDRGGSTKSSRFRARIMVIRGNRPKHGQVQMDMRIHPARHYQLAGSINHLNSIGHRKVSANGSDLFTFDQQV